MCNTGITSFENSVVSFCICIRIGKPGIYNLNVFVARECIRTPTIATTTRRSSLSTYNFLQLISTKRSTWEKPKVNYSTSYTSKGVSIVMITYVKNSLFCDR